MKNSFVYDAETFPNFLCITLINVDTKEKHQFIIWEYQNDKEALLDFVDRDILLIGYNSISYDAPMLRYITLHEGRNINDDIFQLSKKLIDDERRNDKDILALRYHKDGFPWHNQDLMSMLAYDKIGISLKQVSVNLNWRKIQDLPLHYDHIVKQKDVATILDYNENDALITLELYNNPKVKEIIKVREAASEEYGIDFLSSSDSSMANLLLEYMYSAETGLDPSEFKKLRSPKKAVAFKNIILPVIEFETPELQNLKKELMEVTVFESQKFKFSKKLMFSSNLYNFGIGGLHTDEQPAKYFSDDKIKVSSCDVSSFYPSIMINYGIKPDHIDKKFIDVLKRITIQRLEAKKAKNKVKAESFKIVINSMFGKTGYDNHWLYDPATLIGVTLNGQLFLMMLIEKLELAGIKVISANTDGVECKVPIELDDKYKEIAKEWQDKTKFNLEFIEYKTYVKRDVNNYVAVPTDKKEKIKTKGIFIPEAGISVPFKAYRHPIIGKALYEYFVNGVPVHDTISKSKNIFDFCISQKSAKEFVLEYRTKEKTTILQKTNRFFISTTGGTLLKRKGGGSKYTAGLFVKEYVTILNDYYDTCRFEAYPIKFEFYEKEAQKIIDEIEPKQVQLDMFGGMDLSAVRKKIECPQTEMTVEKIIKQSKGKKFEQSIMAAVKNRETIDINPRMCYVMNVDLQSSPKIEVFPLRSGTIQTLKIKKWNYKPIIVGDILYCVRFSKELDGHYDEKHVWIKDPDKPKVNWLESYEYVNEEKFKKYLNALDKTKHIE